MIADRSDEDHPSCPDGDRATNNESLAGGYLGAGSASPHSDERHDCVRNWKQVQCNGHRCGPRRRCTSVTDHQEGEGRDCCGQIEQGAPEDRKAPERDRQWHAPSPQLSECFQWRNMCSLNRTRSVAVGNTVLRLKNVSWDMAMTRDAICARIIYNGVLFRAPKRLRLRTTFATGLVPEPGERNARSVCRRVDPRAFRHY